MNLRLFLAIDIPERIKTEISEIIDILKKYETDVKWIVPENSHLTVKFLGSTEESRVGSIRQALLPVVSEHAPFPLRVRGAGVFPSEKYPRVIWLGIDDSPALTAVRNDIERCLVRFGFAAEEKEFHPHLTLGRVRDRRGTISLMNEVRRFYDRDFGEFLVDRVHLMKSELRPAGPQYSCLYSLPFAGTGCVAVRE